MMEAAKAAHLALQAALTAALAGPDSTGAFNPALRAKYQAYLSTEPFDPEGAPRAFVMKFADLLAEAQKPDGLTHYGGEALVLAPGDAEALDRLYQVRHSLEHPKPGITAWDVDYLKEAIRPAARITLWLLRHQAVSHKLDEWEHNAVEAAAERIARACS